MTILIVEDNPTNGLILKHLAKKVYDGEIIVDENPVVALARCQKQSFTLVIVDQVMPGMTGVQFTRSLRMLDHFKRTPVVMVTADQADELRNEAHGAGVNDFLTKPVEAIAFRRLVATLIELGDAGTNSAA